MSPSRPAPTIPSNKQLEERPHRIVRLEDADGDGRFDRAYVFADRMMFPEGAHVARRLALRLRPAQHLEAHRHATATAWPTSASNGSKARRSPAAPTTCTALTLGPDGWIYWCKGAFAEQTHIVNGQRVEDRAPRHIFRCRPDGTGLEPVMTGGMDNPVDVVFTPEGERIFSATFSQPATASATA